MGNYLYIWNDTENQCIVASGIEFKDFAGFVVKDGGLVMLSYGGNFMSSYVAHHWSSEFDYVPQVNIQELAKQDIYNWGDFCWADYTGESFPAISDHEIAELLFFGHIARPLGRVTLPSLKNKFMCYIHDDGWLLRLFYSDWDDVATIIDALYPQLDLDELRKGDIAYWVSGESVEVKERSYDIDAVVNGRC